MGLVLQVLDLGTDAAKVILELAQHLLHTLKGRGTKVMHLDLLSLEHTPSLSPSFHI